METRLRYSENHWARDDNKERALKKYLDKYNNPYEKSKVDIFKKVIGKNLAGKNVLDYGGGIGYLSHYCLDKGAKVVLVDIEGTALKTAKYWCDTIDCSDNLHCICSDTFPKELKSMDFDIVILKDIIEHIQDDDNFLYCISECQNRYGKLLLSTQNSKSLNAILGKLYYIGLKGYKNWYGWDDTHLRFYTSSVLKKMLSTHKYRLNGIYSNYIIPYGVNNYNKVWATPVVKISTYFDRFFGGIYPFKNWGWNFVIEATKTTTNS